MKPDFLKGVRFADLTWAGAGPFSTKIFSDFGAEVIKIESSVRLDSVRTGGPFKDRRFGVNRSGYFASRNTGKKSVVLDLKSEEGRALVFDIIRKSDVISNNFGPGAMDRLGLGYDAVRAVKPDIIYLSMPMYGEDGPRAEMLGVGMTISAVTGLMWSTAYGPGDPVGPGTHYPDHAANPYHAAFAVLAALRRKRLTGEGMKIDLSQVESTINFIGTAFVAQAMTGEEPPQASNASGEMAPHGIYRCKGEDAWCAITVGSDAAWAEMARLMGEPRLADDTRFASTAARIGNREALDGIVTTWTSACEAGEVAERLRQAGIPAARVANSRHLVENDVQLAGRGYWQRVEHPELGNSLYASPPYQVDGERVELSRPPLLGEHTREVLSLLLGLDEARLDALETSGVFK
ncbi:benzylsuccinate CoA-transferase BbsF subunit [Mesorhizobium sp. J18]|uniref:CaiB/BaiF CoA transferase family protein n=1 Tax=Mesorhizobium sp. J18 TaxID=935263 RepID=UPI00119B7FD8|nr:CoA transferase [Mesorhizobium sp. J18]TWG90163.1 benzylsuccinate CoA-transferase BbsF subunit [Mesorhizobium sp. J18]